VRDTRFVISPVVKNRALPIAMPGMVIIGPGVVPIAAWKAIHRRLFTAAIAGALPIEKCVVLARYARNSG